MNDQKVLLFLNGEFSPDLFLNFINPSVFVKIAVDGGLRYFRLMQIPPDILIGDLDSVTPEDIAWARQHTVQIIQYPSEKDETDFQLALNWVLDHHFTVVRIAGALGGRLDQTMANCFLLLDERLKTMDLRFDDGKEEVSLIRDQLIIEGQPGDTISLIPLQGNVKGVQTHRLKYPLMHEELFMHRARGISNVMLESTAAIEIQEGNLLCIHTRQEP
jgi:thiamine pyrophosphokinase